MYSRDTGRGNSREEGGGAFFNTSMYSSNDTAPSSAPASCPSPSPCPARARVSAGAGPARGAGRAAPGPPL